MSNEIIQNIYQNTKYLCKKNGIPLAEIEREIGVSAGYLSRVANSIGDIGILKVCRIAEELETSVGDLIDSEMWKTDRIKELREEIERLINNG